MDALWLIPPSVAQDFAPGANPERALLASHLASTRLRTGVAARAWKAANHRNFYAVPDDPESMAQIDFAAVRLCIVGKLFLDVSPEAWLAASVHAREAGAKIIIDICDFPFERKPPAMVHFYQSALRMADALTVNSQRMAELIEPYASRAPQVIEDAILAPSRRPEFSPGKVLELLWFGHINNVQYLERMFDALIAHSATQRCRLNLVCEPGRGLEQAVQQISANYAPQLTARFTPWSLEATQAALRQSDIVLIPGDPHDPFKSGVSSNRLAETIQAGRLAVASPLASYLPFQDSAWLGEDLVAGIRWAMANRGEALLRIRHGQQRVAERLDLAVIGGLWRQLFDELAAA